MLKFLTNPEFWYEGAKCVLFFLFGFAAGAASILYRLFWK